MPGTESGIRNVVRERYAAVVRGEKSGCGCSTPPEVATAIGYSEEELAVAQQANLGLGCGNPLAITGRLPTPATAGP
jgi:arsenite methyltransferase